MVILCHYTLSPQPLSPPPSEVFSDVFMWTEYLKEKERLHPLQKKPLLRAPRYPGGSFRAVRLPLPREPRLINSAMKHNFGRLAFIYLYLTFSIVYSILIQFVSFGPLNWPLDAIYFFGGPFKPLEYVNNSPV